MTRRPAEGRLTETIDWNPWGDLRNPRTLIEWGSAGCPHLPTRITSPDDVITEFSYDSDCNREWQQTGGPARRVVFTAHPVHGMVTSVQEPGISQPVRFSYNDQGNLRLARSARGFISLFFSDGIGRDTLAVLPIDTVSARDSSALLTAGIRQRTWYSIMSRADSSHITSPAQTDPDTTAKTLWVRTGFDPEGAPLYVWRSTDENAALTEYSYDSAGRLQQESSEAAEKLFLYDAADNLVRRITGLDTVWMQYDTLNRVIRRIVPPRDHAPEPCPPWVGACSFQFPL